MSKTVWVKFTSAKDADGVLWFTGTLKGSSAAAGCSCGNPACRDELIASVFHELLSGFVFEAAQWRVGIKVDGAVYRAPARLVPVSRENVPGVLH